MKKIFSLLIFVLIFTLVACNGIASHDDNDVAAIVGDDEVLVKDLRFLYEDSKALDYLIGAVQVKLVEQEVERNGWDVSENLAQIQAESSFDDLSSIDKKTKEGKQIHKFAEAQASKLDLTPEVYQKQFADKIFLQNAYIITYFEHEMDNPDLDFDSMEIAEIMEMGSPLLEALMQAHQGDVEILIK